MSDNLTEDNLQKMPETRERRLPQFLPKILGQKVTIRLSDGRLLQGELKAFNAYELLIGTPRGETIVFKGQVATIDYEPPKEKEASA